MAKKEICIEIKAVVDPEKQGDLVVGIETFIEEISEYIKNSSDEDKEEDGIYHFEGTIREKTL